MKILHVTKKYPNALGGDAVVVSNLRKQQALGGHDVAILTSNCDEIEMTDNIYKFGLNDMPAQLDAITPRRLLSLLMLTVKMFGMLGKIRPDVIHTHSIDMAFFVSFAARYYRIPIVHTFHIVTFYNMDQSLLRRKSELLLAKSARLSAVTAPNNYDVRKLSEAGLNNVVLLPNGVDQSMWTMKKSAKKKSRATFIAVGRLEKQKGYEYLIRAAARMTDLRALQILIIGEGSQETVLRKLIESLHLEDVVFLMGRKSAEEVRELMSDAYAAVFCSLYETTPLTLLEAWAAGVPVISTPVGILYDADIDCETAIIVPLKDDRALANAMRKCLEDASLREDIVAAGFEECSSYNWTRIAQIAEEIYRGVK